MTITYIDVNFQLEDHKFEPKFSAQEESFGVNFGQIQPLTKYIGGGGITPSGEVKITQNGTHDVSEFETADVQVPVPEGYVMPAGALVIEENGNYDVREYAGVSVNVEASVGGTDTRLADFISGALTEIDDASATSVRAYAFYKADKLTRANLPNVASIGTNAFVDCTSLVSVDMPVLTSSVATFAFDGCSALKYVNIPNAAAVNNYSFRNTAALERLELGDVTSIGSYSFSGSGITALIIRNNTSRLTKLNATNAFSNTPIAKGTGYIYFYREYVDAYKAANVWSTYASQIRAIEDYPEICG